MTTTTTAPAFEDPEGLRRLLNRLHRSGRAAWRHDAEAGQLVQYTIKKYGALARRHHLEPEDAAPAAIRHMRTRAVREARDPWAVLTRAVQLELIAEDRGAGLLCSPDRARKLASSELHDAYRFGERDGHMADHLADSPAPTTLTWAPSQDDDARTAKARVDAAVDELIALFEACGWPGDVAAIGVELICARRMSNDSAATTFDYLRRDATSRAQLDIDQRCWLAMLRTVLGDPNPDRAHTWAGRGALVAALRGMSAYDLLQLTDLVRPISRARPHRGGRDE